MQQHSDTKILEFILIEDLNEEMKYLATFVGLETVKQLMELLGGTRISIPKPSSYKPIALKRFLKDKKIEFNDIEIKKLSRRFDLNENTCRKIILQNLVNQKE